MYSSRKCDVEEKVYVHNTKKNWRVFINGFVDQMKVTEHTVYCVYIQLVQLM